LYEDSSCDYGWRLSKRADSIVRKGVSHHQILTAATFKRPMN
jgi:hypothetical protein